jgi:hypothetical protein
MFNINKGTSNTRFCSIEFLGFKKDYDLLGLSSGVKEALFFPSEKEEIEC